MKLHATCPKSNLSEEMRNLSDSFLVNERVRVDIVVGSLPRLKFDRTGQPGQPTERVSYAKLRNANGQTDPTLGKWLVWSYTSISFRQNMRVTFVESLIRPASFEQMTNGLSFSHTVLNPTSQTDSLPQASYNLICLGNYVSQLLSCRKIFFFEFALF